MRGSARECAAAAATAATAAAADRLSAPVSAQLASPVLSLESSCEEDEAALMAAEEAQRKHDKDLKRREQFMEKFSADEIFGIGRKAAVGSSGANSPAPR